MTPQFVSGKFDQKRGPRCPTLIDDRRQNFAQNDTNFENLRTLLGGQK